MGFVLLKLAIATSEASSSCNSEPHLRVIIRVAHLKFLLVLRLPAGIDLRDQVDLAPARSITIGSCDMAEVPDLSVRRINSTCGGGDSRDPTTNEQVVVP